MNRLRLASSHTWRRWYSGRRFSHRLCFTKSRTLRQQEVVAFLCETEGCLAKLLFDAFDIDLCVSSH
jgi:hypothetical protein